MLTESEERYLQTIPESSMVQVKPWDPKAAQIARELIEKIRASAPELEVFWSGALALEISGQNDIDLSILGDPKDFNKYLPKLIEILGEPQKKNEESIMWRTTIEEFKLDTYLGDKNSETIKFHKKIFGLLRDNPNLLEEYRSLKEAANGMSLREYQRRKYEFYHKILP